MNFHGKYDEWYDDDEDSSYYDDSSDESTTLYKRLSDCFEKKKVLDSVQHLAPELDRISKELDQHLFVVETFIDDRDIDKQKHQDMRQALRSIEYNILENFEDLDIMWIDREVPRFWRNALKNLGGLREALYELTIPFRELKIGDGDIIIVEYNRIIHDRHRNYTLIKGDEFRVIRDKIIMVDESSVVYEPDTKFVDLYWIYEMLFGKEEAERRRKLAKQRAEQRKRQRERERAERRAARMSRRAKRRNKQLARKMAKQASTSKQKQNST